MLQVYQQFVLKKSVLELSLDGRAEKVYEYTHCRGRMVPVKSYNDFPRPLVVKRVV